MYPSFIISVALICFCENVFQNVEKRTFSTHAKDLHAEGYNECDSQVLSVSVFTSAILLSTQSMAIIPSCQSHIII